MDEAEARKALADGSGLLAFGDPPGTYALRRVRGGWLAWADLENPPEGWPSGIRLELREVDNTPLQDSPWFQEWPVWPAEDIAARIDAGTDHDRFPPYVQAILETSGWFPGRAIPEHHLNTFAAELANLPIEEEDDPPVLHPAARTALREFGGLQLRATPTGGGLHIAPDPGHTWDADETTLMNDAYEQDFCIVAHETDTEILMAEDGFCLAAGLNYCRAGDTFENMITFMLTHPRPFPTLDVNADAAETALRAGRRPRP
jgi:hypothetical protein